MQVGRCLMIFHNLILKRDVLFCPESVGVIDREIEACPSTGVRQCLCISPLSWGLCVFAVTFVYFLF